MKTSTAIAIAIIGATVFHGTAEAKFVYRHMMAGYGTAQPVEPTPEPHPTVAAPVASLPAEVSFVAGGGTAFNISFSPPTDYVLLFGVGDFEIEGCAKGEPVCQLQGGSNVRVGVHGYNDFGFSSAPDGCPGCWFAIPVDVAYGNAGGEGSTQIRIKVNAQ